MSRQPHYYDNPPIWCNAQMVNGSFKVHNVLDVHVLTRSKWLNTVILLCWRVRVFVHICHRKEWSPRRLIICHQSSGPLATWTKIKSASFGIQVSRNVETRLTRNQKQCCRLKTSNGGAMIGWYRRIYTDGVTTNGDESLAGLTLSSGIGPPLEWQAKLRTLLKLSKLIKVCPGNEYVITVRLMIRIIFPFAASV